MDKMKTCNKCLVSSLNFHRDSTSKDGLHSLCKECKNVSRRAWKKLNVSKNRISSREYYKKNSDVYKANAKNWRKANPGKANFITSKRRKGIKIATPIWANENEIKRIYENCPKGFHVDHVIPLHGKDVCGLHVESNLQYLSASENCKKGNKYGK